MNDDLMDRIKSCVSYMDYHRPNADAHLKELMLDDMYKLLKEIVELNEQE